MLVAVNVGRSGFLNGLQQLLLFVGGTAGLEERHESGNLAAVFCPPGQELVNQLRPLHQEHFRNDAAVLVGVSHAVLRQLQFEQTFVEFRFQASVDALHAVQSQIGGSQQDGNEEAERDPQSDSHLPAILCAPLPRDVSLRWAAAVTCVRSPTARIAVLPCGEDQVLLGQLSEFGGIRHPGRHAWPTKNLGH